MTLVGLIVALLLIGVALWAIQRFPLDATLKNILWVLLIVVAAVLVILFVARIFGYQPNLHIR